MSLKPKSWKEVMWENVGGRVGWMCAFGMIRISNMNSIFRSKMGLTVSMFRVSVEDKW